MHASEEGVAPGGATLLGIVSQELRTLMPDAVDVGRFTDGQTSVIDARLHPADVIPHDEQNVWLRLLSHNRSDQYSCHADREYRQSGDRSLIETSFFFD